ncbi:thiamine phosphate synthase [Sphingobacterium sp. SRCM116780]|uniref:thiamine phosphate synthase n=1 Tax=Sphingobacterium sp. SRCM116780 TaxID=2907623 RepID=UPI001F32ACAA|nr:thiamine phosphate synthase [Sphingobacterium sp. SRCM116780]UIR56900.1 thiamine phosphate synthase [Sphingobacterium sp. SRCM116780]
MIIILTPEQNVRNELTRIHQLFQAGLELLHIRKYTYSALEMYGYISAIDESFRNRLVLHTHHELAQKTAVNRLHFNERDRVAGKQNSYTKDYILSTSVHSMDDFNALDQQWSYAFLSPMFTSISKPGYGQNNSVQTDLHLRKNNQVQLIGLGGIREDNISLLLNNGVDGVALLGTIWKNQQPITNFKACLQQDLSY